MRVGRIGRHPRPPVHQSRVFVCIPVGCGVSRLGPRSYALANLDSVELAWYF